MLLVRLLLALLLFLAALPARADDAEPASIVARFADAGSYADVAKLIDALAATGDPAVTGALQALSNGDLYVRRSDRAVVIGKQAGRGFELLDPLTGGPIGRAAAGELEKVKVKNSLRSQIREAIGALTLAAGDPAVRLRAAETAFQAANPSAIAALEHAIAREGDRAVRQRLLEAHAASVLMADAPEADRSAAIAVLAARGDNDALARLNAFAAGAEGRLKEEAERAISHIRQTLELWRAGQNVWYGLSLGSVLLLAAIGLSITFGVMGVINMAHGEMVMLGAYTTFVVQSLIRAHLPFLFDWSLLIALPLAFAVAGLVGLLIERGVIRFLYGRPLETLLATWGVSLILQQAVRSIFGPTNQDVGNPGWMSGAFTLGQLTITWNRLWIVLFALAVFASLLFVLRRTHFGLEIRAVTQNRAMAAAMGIRTARIDALTFALGSGIAGIAGVALSQIDNVSPNLGQSYIIDSFMVVVFGGVGNLWGTLLGAMSLGIVSKFLEPHAGAVLGKILVLVFIILFIQKRPRGLFAQKGRAVEA